MKEFNKLNKFVFVEPFNTYYELDVAESWGLNFQDPATPIMEGIMEFHNHLMFFIVLIAM